jgi:hypothetical protein
MNVAWVLLETTDTISQPLFDIGKRIEWILHEYGIPVRILLVTQNDQLHVVDRATKQPIKIPEKG